MSDPKQVINIGYNGASFTTFIGYNPNYKTYEIDEHNFVCTQLLLFHFTKNIRETVQGTSLL